MSVVYVAGPMTGIAGFNYPAFDAAEAALSALGHDVLNPTSSELLNPTPGVSQSWAWYMRLAVQMVAVADGIALLPGWQESRGAVLEHTIGAALGLDIRPLSEWVRS